MYYRFDLKIIQIIYGVKILYVPIFGTFYCFDKNHHFLKDDLFNNILDKTHEYDFLYFPLILNVKYAYFPKWRLTLRSVNTDVSQWDLRERKQKSYYKYMTVE